MDAPKLKLSTGTWTPERLIKVAAVLLLLAHLPAPVAMALDWFFFPTARMDMSSRWVIAVQFPMIVFCLAAFYQRVPTRLAAVIFLADTVFWVLSAAFEAPLGWSGALVSAIFILPFLLSSLALFRLPRHERW